jgi:hypothetical protein
LFHGCCHGMTPVFHGGQCHKSISGNVRICHMKEWKQEQAMLHLGAIVSNRSCLNCVTVRVGCDKQCKTRSWHSTSQFHHCHIAKEQDTDMTQFKKRTMCKHIATVTINPNPRNKLSKLHNFHPAMQQCKTSSWHGTSQFHCCQIATRKTH